MERESWHTSDSVEAYWYPATSVLLVIYKGTLLPEATTTAYKIGMDVIAKYGAERLRGIIGDFTGVTYFPNANLSVANSQSKRVNKSENLSHVAVALLVSTLMQERFVWLTAQINGTDYRSKIVYSMEQAFAFIDDYRKSYDVVEE